MLRRCCGMQHMAAIPSEQARHFQDSQHRDWRVFERRKQEPGGKSVKILVFESESSFRVVRTYPANWRELEPEALEYLSWRV